MTSLPLPLFIVHSTGSYLDDNTTSYDGATIGSGHDESMIPIATSTIPTNISFNHDVFHDTFDMFYFDCVTDDLSDFCRGRA